MKHSAKADKRTLIRRATFDLHGLPPTAQEVNAFLEDESPDAWENVIDRLLASPRYGEAMGAALAGCGALLGHEGIRVRGRAAISVFVYLSRLCDQCL